MIIRFILKNLRVFADILIVAALVGAFAYFDPFGWLRGPLKIKDTPLVLSSVRDIGQLVTAEYYGEAIASLADTVFEDYSPAEVNNEAVRVYKMVLDSTAQLRREKPGHWWIANENERNILNKFAERFPDLAENPFFEKVLLHYSRFNMLLAKENDLAVILWHIYEKQQPTLRAPEQFATATFPIQENGKKLKNQLVYIGRGTVKAGIDFGTFTERNFWYNSNTHKIYLYNVEPKILDYDINPWFIPEKGVRGYELVKITGKLKKDPLPAATRVKLRCRENLRAQAIEAGIISQAKENARQSLKALFSLLLEDEVADVVFLQNKYDHFAAFLSDSIVSPVEARSLLKIVEADFTSLDTLWYDNPQDQVRDLMDFCQRLKRIETSTKGVYATRYGLVVCSWQADEVLEKQEITAFDSLVANFSLPSFPKERRWIELFTAKKLDYDSLVALKKSGQWPPFITDGSTKKQWLSLVSRKLRKQRIELVNKIFWSHYSKNISQNTIWFSSVKEQKAEVEKMKRVVKR